MDQPIRYTFPKTERLCHQKKIQALFSSGNSFLIYPFKIVYLLHKEGEFPIQLAISVSKRYSKRAVARNRVKRLIRESYRLNRNELQQKLIAEGNCLDLIIIYVGKKEESFLFMESRMQLVLKRLQGCEAKV
jgi:ribonuclease P protein component